MHISISTGTVLKITLIAALAWLLYELRHLVLLVLTAVVISTALAPLVRKLMRITRSRILAVIAVYLTMIAIFFMVIFFFVPSVMADVSDFIVSIPTYLSTLEHIGVLDQYSSLLGLAPPSQLSVTDLFAGVRDSLSVQGVSAGMSNAVHFASTVFSSVFSFVLIIVFSFYFTVLETGVDDFLEVVVPKRHQKYVVGLWKRSQHKIGLWLQGQLLLAFIMGVLVFLGLSILGVPHALVLSLIASCLEIIPVFGPILAALPAVAIAFTDGGLSLGLLTIALYVIAQQFENHLIYPLVVTRVVGVPPLMVILALLVGAHLAGILGIILSVPVAATIRELVSDLKSGQLQEHFGYTS